MNYEYFATNVIPVNSQKEINDYMKLCWSYITNNFGKLHVYNSVPPTYGRLMKADRNRIMNAYKNPKNPAEGFREPMDDFLEENFNLVNYGHAGFLANIIYDKKNKCFKLRLYADKSLRERNLDVLCEPMRVFLTSGPESLGLGVRREIEESIEPIQSSLMHSAIKNYHKKRMNREIRENAKTASIELGESESFEGGVEAWLYASDEKDHAANRLERLKMEQKHFLDYSYLPLLESKADIFRETRDVFAAEFPEQANEFNGTAYGSFPMVYITDSSALVGSAKSFLPIEEGFDDRRLSLLGAKIIERPESGECANIISLYPYTSPADELNELHFELLEDDEIIEGIFAHEFAEIRVRNQIPSVQYNLLRVMVDRNYSYMLETAEMEQTQERHHLIDKIMSAMGYGEQTKKCYSAYIAAAETAAEEMIPGSVRWRFSSIKDSCEEQLKAMQNI